MPAQADKSEAIVIRAQDQQLRNTTKIPKICKIVGQQSVTHLR